MSTTLLIAPGNTLVGIAASATPAAPKSTFYRAVHLGGDTEGREVHICAKY